jgi:inosine-uridine nucleoside N-ribohydrolase
MSQKHKLVISTDIGTDVDDAIAVYLAATHPDIDLKGIWVTNGDVATRAMIAHRLLKYANKKVPIFIGEPFALSGKQPFMHGYEKNFAFREKHEHINTIQSDGLAGMIQLLESEQDIELASIAPMTNLARLLKEAPESAKKIKRVYAMACRENANEHNIGYDVPAAVEVFNSDLPITIVSGDICDKFLIEAKPLIYETPEIPAVEYISEMAMAWKLYKMKVPMIEIGKKLDNRMVAGLSKAPKMEIEAYFTTKERLRKPAQNLSELKDQVFHLNALSHKYPELNDLKQELDRVDPKLFAVHDAYAIFCMTNSESIKTKPCEAKIDEFGHTSLAPYDKHEWVTSVDYDKFKDFVYKGLRLS